jgi:hypothetical protein
MQGYYIQTSCVPQGGNFCCESVECQYLIWLHLDLFTTRWKLLVLPEVLSLTSVIISLDMTSAIRNGFSAILIVGFGSLPLNTCVQISGHNSEYENHYCSTNRAANRSFHSRGKIAASHLTSNARQPKLNKEPVCRCIEGRINGDTSARNGSESFHNVINSRKLWLS